MPKALLLLRSRLPVIVAVTLTTLVLVVGASRFGNLQAAWRMLRIPAMEPGFVDLRGITNPIDCALKGLNPYTTPNCGSLPGIAFNYPAVWLDLRYLGITSRSTTGLGIALAVMTVIALLCLFSAKTKSSALVIFLAALSYPLLLGVERGNSDLCVFSLLVFGLFLIDKLEERFQLLACSVLIIFLTVLKIYPIAAVLILLRRRTSFLPVATGLVAAGAFFLMAGVSLSTLLNNTTKGLTEAFGAVPFFLIITWHISHRLELIMGTHQAISSGIAILFLALAMPVGWIFRERLNRFLPPLNPTDAWGRMAIAGLAIYCFAFCSGTSWDYRLVFLLGPLAVLVRDLNLRQSMRSLPACLAILVLLDSGYQDRLLINALSDGLVFAISSLWLGVNIISWLLPRSDVRRRQNPDEWRLGVHSRNPGAEKRSPLAAEAGSSE